jgi:hypothetical protein
MGQEMTISQINKRDAEEILEEGGKEVNLQKEQRNERTEIRGSF